MSILNTASGWEIENSEFMNRANRGGHVRVEMFVDETNISVELDSGSGYMNQNLSADIPIEVLVALLANAGYTVTRP